MDQVGADNNKNPIIISGQNPGCVVASGGDGLLRDRSRDDLVAEQGGLDEGVILEQGEVRNERRGER